MIRQEVALRPGANGTLCEAEASLEWMYMGGKRMSWREESCGEEMGKEQRQRLLGKEKETSRAGLLASCLSMLRGVWESLATAQKLPWSSSHAYFFLSE